MNLTEIRRARLKAWFAKRTLPPDEKSYLSQLIGGKSSFGEKAARRLEQTYEMPAMFLDTPLDTVAPTATASAITFDQAELLALWAQLLPGERAEFIDQIKAKADHNRQVREQPIETVTVSMSESRFANLPAPFANRRKDHG